MAELTMEKFKAELSAEQKVAMESMRVGSLEAMFTFDDETLERRLLLLLGQIGDLRVEEKRRKAAEKEQTRVAATDMSEAVKTAVTEALRAERRKKRDRSEDSEEEEERKSGERAGRREEGLAQGFLADRYHLRLIHPNNWENITPFELSSVVSAWGRAAVNKYVESELHVFITLANFTIEEIAQQPEEEAVKIPRSAYVVFLRLIILLLRILYPLAADVAQATVENIISTKRRDIRVVAQAMQLFSEAEAKLSEEAEAKGRGSFRGGRASSFRGRATGTNFRGGRGTTAGATPEPGTGQ